MKTVGLTYDLKTDYKFKEGDPLDANAEFDSSSTIDVIADAIAANGFKVKKIGNANNLLEKIDKCPDPCDPESIESLSYCLSKFFKNEIYDAEKQQKLSTNTSKYINCPPTNSPNIKRAPISKYANPTSIMRNQLRPSN